MPLVGPSENGKSQLIHKWLKKGTFLSEFNTNYFFCDICKHYDVMQKLFDSLDFVQGVNFEFIDSLKDNDTKLLLTFDDSCKEICNSKMFVVSQLPEAIVDSVLFTWSTTCLIKANLRETLSSRTHTLFSSNLPVMWNESAHLVLSCILDQN